MRENVMTASPINPNEHRRPATNPGDEMLTLQEACAYLRIPEGTLRYWRHLGSGPRSFKVGRHVRYWRADLILWLTEQTNRPQRDA
jgi:excisionase family DNA binding protein